MRNRNYLWASIMLIVLVALGALGVTFYAFRGRLATAPFIVSMFGRAQVGAPAAGAAQPPAPAPAGADGVVPAPDASEARAEVAIDPKRQQLIGVRTVPVERTSVSPTIRGIGLVRYDETRLADVNLKLEGWIRDLYVDYTGHYVRKGQPLFTLYSPELLSTQNEYLLALKTRDRLKQSQIPDARESSERLVELARQRLDLWDLPPDQFMELQQTRKPQELWRPGMTAGRHGRGHAVPGLPQRLDAAHPQPAGHVADRHQDHRRDQDLRRRSGGHPASRRAHRADFEGPFQYSNLMVSAGGYIAAKKANPAMPYGQAYDEAMRTRVLEPIGMKSSTFDFAVAEKREHANPHGYSFSLPRAPISMPLGTEKWIPAVRPAGGLWSSADDMARWVAVELNEGKTIEGKQIVTSQNLLERRKPMVRMGEKLSYGLALAVGRQAGVETAGHGGGTFGFNTLAVFLPEHGIGLVLLTNSGDAGAFLNAASRRLLEILFDGKDEAKQTFEFALERRDEAIAKETAKVDKAPSKEWAQRLEGAYTNPILGCVVVRWEKDRAVLDAGDWKAPIGLMKEDDGNDKLVPLEPPWIGFDFLAKGNGNDTTLTLDVGQEKYVFTKTK